VKYTMPEPDQPTTSSEFPLDPSLDVARRRDLVQHVEHRTWRAAVQKADEGNRRLPADVRDALVETVTRAASRPWQSES
jgi:hypothetical protein